MAAPLELPQRSAEEQDVNLKVTNESIQLRFRCSTGVAVLLGVTGLTLGDLYGRDEIQLVIKRLLRSIFGFCKITPGPLDLVVDVDCISAKRVKELLQDYQCGKLKRRLVEELQKIDGSVENLKIKFEGKETLEINGGHESRIIRQSEEKQPEETEEQMSRSEYIQTIDNIRKMDGVTEKFIHLSGKNSLISYLRVVFLDNNEMYRDENGRTMMHYAVVYGNQLLIEILLRRSPSNINAQDHDGRTALHLACIPQAALRHEDTTYTNKLGPSSSLFTSNRVDINAVDSENRTPLHYAAMYSEQLVQLFVSRDANIYANDTYGKTPLDYAFEYGKTEAIEFLLLHYGNEKAKKGESLLKIMKDINTVDEEGRNILHRTAVSGSPEAITALLDAGVDMNAKDKIGKSALDYALELSNLGAAVALFEHIFEVQWKDKPDLSSVVLIEKYDMKDSDSRTMLHHSVIHFKQNVFNLLLGYSINKDDRDITGKSPLHYAFEIGNIEAAEKLLKDGASVKGKDNEGRTVLHLVTERVDENMIDLLLQNNANVNEIDSEGNSSLHYAVRGANVAIAEKLIKAGSSVEAKNDKGQTVLHLAAKLRDENLITLLLKNTANISFVDNKGKSVLYNAVKKGNFAIVEKLVKAAVNYEGTAEQGQTVLHLAAKHDDRKLITLLLRKNANVNDVDRAENSALHYAAGRGNVAIVEKLIKAGASIERKNTEGKTALHIAAELGYKKMIELLLESTTNVKEMSKNVKEMSKKRKSSGRKDIMISLRRRIKQRTSMEEEFDQEQTVLHIAAQYGDEKLFDLLLGIYANVDDIDSEGNSVLYYAVNSRNFSIAKKILEAGANVEGKDHEGRTVLQLATQHGDEEMTDLLLKNNANVNDVDSNGNSALYYAVYSGNFAIAKKLLEAGASVEGEDKEGRTVLHLAAENSDERMIDLLLKNDVNVNDVDSEGNSVLHYAVNLGNVAIVEKLLQAEANVEEKDNQGRTVLHLAAEHDDEKLIDLLMKNKANVNDIDHKGNSVLYYAVNLGNLEIARKLLEAKASVVEKNDEGQTILHLAARNGDENMVDLLLESNANVNDIDNDGNSALHYAVNFGNVPIAEKLINFGALVEEKDSEGRTVLHLAALNAHEKMLGILMKYNNNLNDLNSKGKTALYCALEVAVKTVDPSLAYMLAEAGAKAPLLRTGNGRTFLHNAVRENRLDILEILIQCDVFLNDYDCDGETALHYAVEAGNFEATRLLVEGGAGVNVKNRKTFTPLHRAAMLRYDNITELLLEYKADPSAEDYSGRTALRYATESHRKLDIIEKMNESMASLSLQDDSALIGPSGGVIQLDDVILEIQEESLIKDTKISLVIKTSQDFVPNSLLGLGLVNGTLRVVKFLPHGLKFLKPAVLTIKLKQTVSVSEHFVLHGCYNYNCKKILWEVVSNGIENDEAEGVLYVKINGFSFYNFILAMREMLARILCHINYSFVCRAYALYRRKYSMRSIDIAVVLVSEFVDDNSEENIKQLKDHFDRGYHTGEKGRLTRLHTDRPLQICLKFSGLESCQRFEVNQAELDSSGYAISDFMGVALRSPADGHVEIREVIENTLLWELTVTENDETDEKTDVQSSESGDILEVVYQTTKLTNAEISRMSCRLGLDWDNVAGLLDIPYYEREEIRFNFVKFSSKAEQVFLLFNDSQSFNRCILVKCLNELGREDLIDVMLPQENKGQTEDVETQSSQTQIPENDQVLIKTRLSSRELYRLSRRIVVDWESLAGLLDIPAEDRNIIRTDDKYNDVRSRAEKMLSIFNRRKDFSRQKLAGCLEEIGQLELIESILRGEWRSL